MSAIENHPLTKANYQPVIGDYPTSPVQSQSRQFTVTASGYQFLYRPTERTIIDRISFQTVSGSGAVVSVVHGIGSDKDDSAFDEQDLTAANVDLSDTAEATTLAALDFTTTYTDEFGKAVPVNEVGGNRHIFVKTETTGSSHVVIATIHYRKKTW